MLVDDHAVVRAGYKRFIELDPVLKVIAEASSGEEAYTFLESNPVDVIIMDLSMPGQGGFETLRRLLNRFPQQKILISYHVRAGYPFVTPSKWSILEPSASPLPVVEDNFPENEFKWIINGDSLNISDYLNRQPITGLLIAKDGVLLYEKYQYNATQNSLFLSNSMAKSVVGIGIGMLREDGLITGFEDRAEKYLPELTHLHHESYTT